MSSQGEARETSAFHPHFKLFQVGPTGLPFPRSGESAGWYACCSAANVTFPNGIASALTGGVLIGLSASLFLLAHGRVAGISGIFGGLLQATPSDTAIRGWFLFGLLLAGLGARALAPSLFLDVPEPRLGIVVVAGLLVGFGTRLGNGCTSGHGVCGLSRLSLRSLWATLTFVSTGALAVLLSKHVWGA